MKSMILDKGEHYYTHLLKVFQAIGDEQIKYNWLITNFECYPEDEEVIELFSKEYVWISGEQLTEIIHKDDFQFIWGVFSGFSKGTTLAEALNYDLPFADGYEGFWVDNVNIQHPLADIEIVAWDSSLTLLISKDDDLVDKFSHSFPLSTNLSEQNTRNNSQIAHIEELMIQELFKRNIEINDETLHHKYLIWNKLSSKRKKLVKDTEILRCIRKQLTQSNRHYYR
jgi:hypothetical protein